MQKRVRIDFHCHTLYSPDSLTPIQKVIASAKRKGIDKVVITDHNTIKGARLAYAEYPENIIIGEEIKTTHGELLAAFVQEEIPQGLTPLDTIQRLRQQNAFISVSHPFDRRRSGWALDELLKIAPLVDAIEIFNARCFNRTFNLQATQFAQQQQMPGTVGSDAHTPMEIGQAVLELPDFHDTQELRQAIKQGIPISQYTSPWILVFSVYTRLYKRIKQAKP